MVISPSVEIVVIINVLIDGTNETGGEEVDIAQIGDVAGFLNYSSLELVSREGVFRLGSVLIVVAKSDVIE